MVWHSGPAGLFEITGIYMFILSKKQKERSRTLYVCYDYLLFLPAMTASYSAGV